jgi:hypothetical protein
MFLFLNLSFPLITAYANDQTLLSVTQAEDGLVSAYKVVLDAEKDGANVTGLLDTLNLGGEYLAKAYIWIHLGDLSQADHFAGLCVEIVDNVSNEALFLRDEAEALRKSDAFFRSVGSVLGLVVVLIGGFVVWRVFKRRYITGIQELKPEVAVDES